jgi:hypothetical protein
MRLIQIVISLSLLLVPAALAQKQITIKVLDGRNGHPLENVVVYVWFGQNTHGSPLGSSTGPDGTALVAIPEGEKTFVAAGEFIADCRGGNLPGKSFIDRNVYSIDEVLKTGTVGENQCGEATAQPIRDTFILFLRPLHWWEKLHD